MEEIQFKLDASNRGEFYLEVQGKKLAEMTFSVNGSIMTVYHTEVDDSLKGRGIAQYLLDAMEAYVRKNGLKVIPLCKYVNLQFRRNPDRYRDISTETH
jgi:predicted GNAT family acetyltransferase